MLNKFLIFANGNLHATLCKTQQTYGGAIAGDYFFSLKIHQRYSATYRYITIPGGTTENQRVTGDVALFFMLFLRLSAPLKQEIK